MEYGRVLPCSQTQFHVMFVPRSNKMARYEDFGLSLCAHLIAPTHKPTRYSINATSNETEFSSSSNIYMML